MCAADAGIDPQVEVGLLALIKEDLDKVAVRFQISPADTFQLDESLRNGPDRLAEGDFNIRVGVLDHPGSEHFEVALGRDDDFGSVIGLESGASLAELDFEDPVLVAPGQAGDAETVFPLVLDVGQVKDGRAIVPGKFDHVPDPLGIEAPAEGHVAFNGSGIGLEQGAVQGEESSALFYGENEGEDLAGLVFHRKDLAEMEGDLVGLSGLEGILVRYEFDKVVLHPAQAAFKGGAEGEETVFRLYISRRGQPDADGTLF